MLLARSSYHGERRCRNSRRSGQAPQQGTARSLGGLWNEECTQHGRSGRSRQGPDCDFGESVIFTSQTEPKRPSMRPDSLTPQGVGSAPKPQPLPWGFFVGGARCAIRATCKAAFCDGSRR
jgi:hypothetical protein